MESADQNPLMMSRSDLDTRPVRADVELLRSRVVQLKQERAELLHHLPKKSKHRMLLQLTIALVLLGLALFVPEMDILGFCPVLRSDLPAVPQTSQQSSQYFIREELRVEPAEGRSERFLSCRLRPGAHRSSIHSHFKTSHAILDWISPSLPDSITGSIHFEMHATSHQADVEAFRVQQESLQLSNSNCSFSMLDSVPFEKSGFWIHIGIYSCRQFTFKFS
jgi:hypothetical protein